jgi:hypothetical protein
MVLSDQSRTIRTATPNCVAALQRLVAVCLSDADFGREQSGCGERFERKKVQRGTGTDEPAHRPPKGPERNQFDRFRKLDDRGDDLCGDRLIYGSEPSRHRSNNRHVCECSAEPVVPQPRRRDRCA